MRKAEFYDAFVHPAANTHNTRDKEQHARKRRVLSQAFSDAAMREMQRYILANIRTFCHQIGLPDGGAGDDEKKSGWTQPRNMSDWCNYLAMDILGDLSFGKAFHMLERPDNRFALDLVEKAASRHLIVSGNSSTFAGPPPPPSLRPLLYGGLVFFLSPRRSHRLTPITPSAAPCPSSTSSRLTSSCSPASRPAGRATWPTARAN